MSRIKIVWLCSLSNEEIRSKIRKKKLKLEYIARKIINRNDDEDSDFAIWNTNAINEIKHIHEIELHILSPVRDLEKERYDFEIDGVQYHFIRDENSSLIKKILRFVFTRYSAKYLENRRNICSIIEEIKPDLVHVIGAENLHYSLAMLDLPESLPRLLQLQALLISIVDKASEQQRREYYYKGKYERELILRADFVGTCEQSFIKYIKEKINEKVKIVNITLAMAQNVNIQHEDKEYDFVHFARLLCKDKATDIAIESFGIVHKLHSEVTLDIIGAYTDEFKQELDRRIRELGLENHVFFEGGLPTHDDVIKQIRKARFALLPLKIDVVPNTLHEAMANGLPLITTITPGTPALNKGEMKALLSEPNDINGIALNMIRLLEDDELQENLKTNAAIYESARTDNKKIVRHWIEIYKAIIHYKKTGNQLPEEWLF